LCGQVNRWRGGAPLLGDDERRVSAVSGKVSHETNSRCIPATGSAA
jgi:hypothetical protein